MACGCGTYTPTPASCNATATVCKNHFVDIHPTYPVVILGEAGFGTTTLLPNGNIRYEPDEDSLSPDGFVYTYASGSCTVTITVQDSIPENTKVITLTASGECEVGTPTFEWDIPECAELAEGYTIYDNPVNIIVPLYDPENPDATCEIKVTVCCDFCNNCCKCENYIWNPPQCVYPCGSNPICTCDEPCHTYNPTTGSCDPCPDDKICCEFGEGSYACRNCCDNTDCPANQECITGNCGCPPGTIENEYGACCPTTLPTCTICDQEGNVVESITVVCDPETEVLDIENCLCECLPGLCWDLLLNECVVCPPCTLTGGRYQERLDNGTYANYNPSCPVCKQCIACEEETEGCIGGFMCIPQPCAAKALCEGNEVDNIINPLPTLSYIDDCTGLLRECSEESPCCCRKVVPEKDKVYICQDGNCNPADTCPDPPIPGLPCYETIQDCNALCIVDPDPEYYICLSNSCIQVVNCEGLPEGTACYETLLDCLGSECQDEPSDTFWICEDNTCTETLEGEDCTDYPGLPCYATKAACELTGCTTPGILGACCIGTGPSAYCQSLTSEECAEAEGVYYGDGIPCTTITCYTPPPPVIGACCIGANCSQLTEAACEVAGGTYYGDYVSCVSVIPCIPTPIVGACCKDNVCFSTTEEGCEEVGGEYQGDVPCEGVECGDPAPLGWCCRNNDCTGSYTQDDCEEELGTWYATENLCDVNCGPSLQPTVWCCIDGDCSYIPESECMHGGGVIWPSANLCNLNCTDNPPIPLSCCENGECREITYVEECTGTVYGYAEDCDNNCLPTPVGACCISGTCYDGMTEENCLASNGTYVGDGEPCVPSSCDSPCDDVIVEGVITDPEEVETGKYIYVPAWSNGNSI
ncbi:MAG TPA: hypothetical protein PKD00_01750 [Burkholderiales bacterium]|nr:hypothetical protein [Burkholderiales bacterium]